MGNKGWILGIDASNLLQGGGRTHLIELLSAIEPARQGIARVVIWGRRSTLELLEDKPWLKKRSPSALEGGLVKRTLWQRMSLAREAREEGCSLLFVPGGNVVAKFHPVVTMSRNMLPFEWTELRRFGVSVSTAKLMVLRYSQAASFRRADGVIFLTEYAQQGVQQVTGHLSGMTTKIPHGINSRFAMQPRPTRKISECTPSTPFRIIYVSIIDEYKHQWHVVEAVASLRAQTGWPLSLDLIGPANPAPLARLISTIQRCDPAGDWVRYHGAVPYTALHELYGGAELGIFASSCENMPNILVEKMAAGLPVACSDRGPMPEILKDAGAYFDPEDKLSIAHALQSMIAADDVRAASAQACYSSAQQYSWAACGQQTIEFLKAVADSHATTCTG